jgi:hypothetical protein
MDKALEDLGMADNSGYKSVNHHGPILPVRNEPKGAIPAYKCAPMPKTAETGDASHSSWQGKASLTAWPENDPGNIARGQVMRQRDKFE